MAKVQLLGDTRSLIMRKLLPTDRTARELATDLGIQVSAVRKHLERLIELRLVMSRFVRQGPGRPKKLYGLTEEGRELFPRRYDSVLNALLSRLTTDRGGEYVQSMLKRVAVDLTEDRGLRQGRRPDRLNRLVDVLNEFGFDASLRKGERTDAITSKNCPIRKAAMIHREIVCEGLHAEIIRRAVGASVERGNWIVNGDPVCTHVLPKAKRSLRPQAK